MSESSDPKKLLVLTGDHSADAHAAKFIQALRQIEPDRWKIAGVGGVAMQAESDIELIADHSQMGVIGIGGVIRAIPSHRALSQRILAWCDEHKPDVAVLVDYGVFHLHLAPRLRKRGIKVIYFIPPQIWASRPWRLKRLKDAADEVLVVLPFEEAYYRSRGLEAKFVGNPVIAKLPPPTTRRELAERFGVDAGRTLIGLFPGSRKFEIKHLLRSQIEAARLLNDRFPQRFTFALSKARNLKHSYFRDMLAAAGGTHLSWLKVIEDNHSLLSASDLIFAASGTLTLEAALYRTPMVVMYRGPWIAYQLAKVFMSVDHAALPNNLASPPGAASGRPTERGMINASRIVPELWQYEVTGKSIAAEAVNVLEPERYARTKRDLNLIAHQFEDMQTPRRVAEAIIRLAGGTVTDRDKFAEA